jgi:hypothetical protein
MANGLWTRLVHQVKSCRVMPIWSDGLCTGTMLKCPSLIKKYLQMYQMKPLKSGRASVEEDLLKYRF